MATVQLVILALVLMNGVYVLFTAFRRENLAANAGGSVATHRIGKATISLLVLVLIAVLLRAAMAINAATVATVGG